MKAISKLCMVLGLSLSATTCFANEASLSDCLSSAGNTSSMRECVFNEVEFYDAKLNKYYKAIMAEAKSVDPEIAKELKQAQVAWIKFNTHNSAFYSKNSGSMYLLESDLAYLTILQARVKEFEQIMSLYGLEDQIE